MSDLLREFQDEMRREKSEQFWKNFGKQMVWLSVAIVIGTIGGVAWKEYKANNAMKQTSMLVEGFDHMEAKNFKAAAETFSQAAAHGSGGIYGIAMLSKAYALTQSGDEAAAQDAYKTLAANNSSGGEAFVSIAKIMAAKNSGDTIEPVKDAPFYHAQMEWKAWQLVHSDKTKDAVEIFTALNDDIDTPQGVRGRASEALQLLAPEKLVPETAGDKRDAK